MTLVLRCPSCRQSGVIIEDADKRPVVVCLWCGSNMIEGLVLPRRNEGRNV